MHVRFHEWLSKKEGSFFNLDNLSLLKERGWIFRTSNFMIHLPTGIGYKWTYQDFQESNGFFQVVKFLDMVILDELDVMGREDIFHDCLEDWID